MNKWPLMHRVLGYIEDKINELVDSVNTPAPTNPKVYRALLTQVGTNAPTAIELENTLGFTPIYSYLDVGDYRLSLPDTPYLKIFTKSFLLSNGDMFLIALTANENQVIINPMLIADSVKYDDVLFNTPIEILVYD